MFKRLLFPGFGLLLMFIAGACADRDVAARQLAVSIEPQRYLLERIAGPGWHVTTMLSRGEDPESFDPSMSDVRRLSDSRAYFTLGTLTFEERLKDQTEGRTQIFDTSRGIARLEGTHGDCDHHHDHRHGEGAEADPHVWASIRNARMMARNMLEAMVEIDEADSAMYRDNYRKLTAELDSIDNVITSTLATAPGHTFMMWHPSLSYFARDYGLTQLSIGLDNKEMSVSGFRHAIEDARRHGASVFFLQPEYDTGRSLSVAAEAGVTAAPVNTLAYDFIRELLNAARTLDKTNEK